MWQVDSAHNVVSNDVDVVVGWRLILERCLCEEVQALDGRHELILPADPAEDVHNADCFLIPEGCILQFVRLFEGSSSLQTY